MKQPIVSVLMPVYNGENYLREAVDSILNQTFTDFEFIIVNDGSTDNTEEILNGYKDTRIRRINNKENLGLVKSLNIALEHAQGKFIARMDADDISMPDRFLKQVEYLKKNPEIRVLGTFMKQIDAEGNLLSVLSVPCHHELIKWKMLFETTIFHPTVMMRKKNVEEAGGYNTNYKHIEDTELWSRMIDTTRFSNLNEVLFIRRWHAKSVCNVHSDTQYKKGAIIRHRLFENLLRKEVSYNTILRYSECLYALRSTIPLIEIKKIIDILIETYLVVTIEKKMDKNIIEEIKTDLVNRLIFIAQNSTKLFRKLSKVTNKIPDVQEKIYRMLIWLLIMNRKPSA